MNASFSRRDIGTLVSPMRPSTAVAIPAANRRTACAVRCEIVADIVYVVVDPGARSDEDEVGKGGGRKRKDPNFHAPF
jgi:hypothetical protein